MFEPGDFQQPEMWLTYSDLRELTHALLRAPDDHDVQTAFASAVAGLGMHGLVAAVAMASCATVDLGSIMGCRPATGVALMSRVRPWRDKLGVATQAMLSAWLANNHRQAMLWADQQIEKGQAEQLAHALGERLVFAVESTALLGSLSSDEYVESFVTRFFNHATA
ncbi:hypothetical protein [Knoellia subterranea]|uniref:Uncharacterized protein n=1 Tax=Knoellia subterranea KCTC 19937 TaxID=1385521 RepID=A0A0A0JU15_9MICO|nr:hypothetical protein [Knoellia subterranea]KGN39542.1 hypothetical protein N803_00340 [Knoellia subterranea KCTC 19937]